METTLECLFKGYEEELRNHLDDLYDLLFDTMAVATNVRYFERKLGSEKSRFDYQKIITTVMACKEKLLELDPDRDEDDNEED